MKKTINYIDLGVHHGQEIDLLVSQYYEVADRVNLNIYGIEANPIISNTLIKKYSEFNDMIHIFNYAVTNLDDNIVKLYLTTNEYLGSSIFATKHNVAPEYLSVNTIKLSSFIYKYIPDFFNSINILKLNIEGAELYVYKDLIESNMLNKFNLLCGHPSHDIEKVSELYNQRDEYYNILKTNNIHLEYFCAEASTSKCINIFNKLGI